MAKAKIDTKNAVREINSLIDSFNDLLQTTNRIGTTSKANFRKVETSLNALKVVANQTDEAFRDLERRYKNMSKSQKNFVTQTRNLKAQTKVLNEEIAKQRIELEKLRQSQKKVKSGFMGMLSGARALIGAFGIISGIDVFARLVLNGYRLTKQFDSLRFTLERITNDMFEAAISQRFLLEITEDYGVVLADTTERWVKFLAAARQAGLSLKDTEDIFRSVTKVGGLLGLQTDELRSVYLALEQMMSKGKITTEELRRQLGERLPGAIGIMAAAIGVNINELDEMMKKGELLSAEVLPKFAKALELAYGTETLEKVRTLTAAQNRLTNAWQRFVRNVSENSGFLQGVFDGMAGTFTKWANFFASEDEIRNQMILENRKTFEKEFVQTTINMLDKEMAAGQKYQDRRDALQEAKDALQLAKYQSLSKEELDVLEQNQADALTSMSEYNDRLRILQRDYAKDNLDITKKQTDTAKKLIDDAYTVLEEQHAQGFGSGEVRRGFLGAITLSNDEVETARKQIMSVGDAYVQSAAELEVFSKFASESKVAVFEEDDDAAGPGSKAWIEYTAPNTIKWYKELIAINKEMMELTTNPDIVAQLQAESDEYQKQIDLLRAKADWKLEDVEDTFDPEDDADPANELAILENAVKSVATALGVDAAAAWDHFNSKFADSEQGFKKFIEKTSEAVKELRKYEKAIEEANQQALERIYADTLNFFDQLAEAILDLRIQNIEKEIQAEEDKYDRLIRLAEDDQEQKKRLEYERQFQLERLAQEKAELEKRQFLAEQGFKLGQIALETALAVFKIQALAATQAGIPIVGPALATATLSQIPFVIGGGAVAAATVLAQTIPAFAEGVTDLNRDTVALINDGGSQEFVERGNKILTTSTENALVSLQKGDTVYTDFADMVKNSMLINSLSNGADLTEMEYSKLGVALTDSIKDGFKGTKVNNVINMRGFDYGRENYKRKLRGFNA